MELKGETPVLQQLNDAAFGVAEQLLWPRPQSRLGSGLLLRWRRPGSTPEASVLDFYEGSGVEAVALRVGLVLRGRGDWAYAIVREIPQFDDLDRPWVRGLLQVLSCTITQSLLASHEIYRDYETAAMFRTASVVPLDTSGFEPGGLWRGLLVPPPASVMSN